MDDVGRTPRAPQLLKGAEAGAPVAVELVEEVGGDRPRAAGDRARDGRHLELRSRDGEALLTGHARPQPLARLAHVQHRNVGPLGQRLHLLVNEDARSPMLVARIPAGHHKHSQQLGHRPPHLAMARPPPTKRHRTRAAEAVTSTVAPCARRPAAPCPLWTPDTDGTPIEYHCRAERAGRGDTAPCRKRHDQTPAHLPMTLTTRPPRRRKRCAT